jgi:hypothetical protein
MAVRRVDQFEPLPTDLDAVARMLAKAKEPQGAQAFRYRFSAAGDPCLRALVYDAHDADEGKPPAQGTHRLRDLLAMACGNAVGAHIEEAAKRLGHETQKSHTFDTGAVKVRGSSDVADPAFVLDVKLVGEKSWARAPHNKHILQAASYAVQNDSPRWILLYVRGSTIFDEDSAEVETRIFAGNADVEYAQELCGIWEMVDRHRKLKTLPERIFGAKPDGYPCAWCRHLDRCAPQGEEQ